MTNQASELDKAIMTGFLYGIQSDLLAEDEVVHRIVAFSHTKGYKEALAIIRTEKLKLLAEVRERVVGEDEVEDIDLSKVASSLVDLLIQHHSQVPW